MESERKMRDLNEIQCFVRAIELKSLTAASKALDLPKSSVSRKIRNLESRLGLTLVVRTTRALNLTDAGRAFFERSALALKEIELAEETADSARSEVEGLLRITGPVEFATGPFNEVIAKFLLAYPKVKIDLLLTERVVDLIGEGFDLAFRIGELRDSTLMAKRLTPFDASIVAGPDYLRNRGMPKSISEIEKHDMIGFAPNGTPLKWPLKGPGGRKEVTPKGRFVVNHLLSLKEAALNGLGLALLPSYMIVNEIRDKSLRVVCPEWSAPGNAIHIVFPGQKFVSPKMRAFIEFAVDKLVL